MINKEELVDYIKSYMDFLNKNIEMYSNKLCVESRIDLARLSVLIDVLYQIEKDNHNH